MRAGATSDELKADYPGKTILLFKHLIYDLTDYTHPGGDIFFVNHNFKEISRYVMGIHPDETGNYPAYVHSQAAYRVLDSHLIGSMIKGPLKNTNSPIINYNNMLLTTFEGSEFNEINSIDLKLSENESQEDSGGEELFEKPQSSILQKERDDIWTLYDPSGTFKSVTEDQWTVHNNSKVSQNLHVIQFTNSKYLVKIQLKGVCWLGKIYFLEGIKKKPYTLVNCLSPEAIKYRQALI